MDSVESFKQLQDKIQTMGKDFAKAQGALEQLLKILQEKHDISSLSDAEKQASELATKRDKARNKFEKQLKHFKKKWGDKL